MNTSITEGGHFIAQDVAAWDAAFFNIPQQEALAIDPQQRMMMEVTYEAFENAGLPIEKIAGTETGVFVGSFTNDYREMLFRDAEAAPRYTATGAGSELLSNRLSWFYDLRGPSMTIGTACSSSLVAVHQVCCAISGYKIQITDCTRHVKVFAAVSLRWRSLEVLMWAILKCSKW